jgi:hypothetical protein
MSVCPDETVTGSGADAAIDTQDKTCSVAKKDGTRLFYISAA